ncbi:hypothetical protein [Halobacillus mangrovi]|nr:hypothetical protein [Halobacillus mangrovi]
MFITSIILFVLIGVGVFSLPLFMPSTNRKHPDKHGEARFYS